MSYNLKIALMKKTLLYYIGLTLMCLALTAITFAAPMTAPVRSLVIPATNAAISIDGVADDDYSVSQSTTAFNITGSTGADADYTMSFQVCFNYQYLYLLATVLDDYACEIPFTSSTNPWTWDNIEVFLSLDTTGTTAAYDSNTVQLRFNRGIQDSAQTPGRAAQEDYKVYYENTADGWVVEVGIPWTAVLQNGAEPEDIMAYISPVVNGFDVSGADNDTDGADARDCQTAWDDDDPAMPDATEDLAWNNRTMFGIMSLGIGCKSCSEISESLCDLSDKTSKNIMIFPNPATDRISISNTEMACIIAIYNMAGTRVLKADNAENIDISSLKVGLYTVVLNNNDVLHFIKN
jgi:hypothetical protein